MQDGHACLRWLVGDDADGLGHALQVLLSQPEIAELFAAVPKFASVLRPLCRMLGARPTPPLPMPPRPGSPPHLAPGDDPLGALPGGYQGAFANGWPRKPG